MKEIKKEGEESGNKNNPLPINSSIQTKDAVKDINAGG